MILPLGLTAQTLERIAVGLVIASLLGWIYHQGGSRCRSEVQVEKAHQEQAQAQTDVRNAHEVAKEERDFHDTTSHPAAPVPAVRLCRPSGAPVPPSGAPERRTHESASNRGENPEVDRPGPDIGPELVTAGRDGDAQVKGLQDYIRNVCLAPRP